MSNQSPINDFKVYGQKPGADDISVDLSSVTRVQNCGRTAPVDGQGVTRLTFSDGSELMIVADFDTVRDLWKQVRAR